MIANEFALTFAIEIAPTSIIINTKHHEHRSRKTITCRAHGLWPEPVGLSQRELAKRAGVTNGMVSLIEQDRVSPSIGSLQKILAAFPMTMAEFFTRDMEGQENVVFRADQLPDVGTGDIQYHLVAASRHDRKMSILSETYEPETDTGEDLLTHSGEEGGVVVEGELELTVAGLIILTAGCHIVSGTPARSLPESSAPIRPQRFSLQISWVIQLLTLKLGFERRREIGEDNDQNIW